MFQYLTLYNNSFICIYMFLQSVLQVTATDSPTTSMTCLNTFFTAYTYHLHYFHIADANTLPHMDQRSPQIVPKIIHHQQTAAPNPTPTEHRGTSTGILQTNRPLFSEFGVSSFHILAGECSARFYAVFSRVLGMIYVLIKLYLTDYFEVGQIC
jgi:hypothetical protein